MHLNRISRRVGRRAFGVLLLALPACGLAIEMPLAQAQPALTQPGTFTAPPLTTEQNAKIERVLSISQYEEFCKSALDLKLEDATIEEIITRIKATFPSKKVEIRQRDARPLKVSLDLKETTVGSVLQAVATLSDCQLWVLPDCLLIAPPGALNSAERTMVSSHQAGEWAQSDGAGGKGWSNSSNGSDVLANLVAEEIKANNPAPATKSEINTTFGNFSPQTQKALQQLAAWTSKSTVSPFVLTANSPVRVNLTNPNTIAISLFRGTSDEANDSLMIRVSRSSLTPMSPAPANLKSVR